MQQTMNIVNLVAASPPCDNYRDSLGHTCKVAAAGREATVITWRKGIKCPVHGCARLHSHPAALLFLLGGVAGVPTPYTPFLLSFLTPELGLSRYLYHHFIWSPEELWEVNAILGPILQAKNNNK